MKVISDPLLFEKHYINSCTDVNDFFYKKIVNDYYTPSQYLGILYPEDGSFIPLVKKNGVVSFYGGLFYNENNEIPALHVNETLEYLIKRQHTFKLLSLKNDCFNQLNTNLKQYDVPYSHNWIINSIVNFNESNHQQQLKELSKKKSDRFRRARKKQDTYFLEEVPVRERKKITQLIKRVSFSFASRGKFFDWQEKESLLFSILDFFKKQNGLYFFVMHHVSQKNIGWFCVIKTKEGFQNILFNIINKIYENDVIILFLKMLGVLKKNNCEYFNFMRGNFGYKNICGCHSSPLYALVNHPDWVPEYDKDLEKESIISSINRDYGCFIN